MATNRIIVGSGPHGMAQGTPSGDTAKASVLEASPTSAGGQALKIGTEEAATGGATIKKGGIIEFFSNLWNGASVVTKIFQIDHDVSLIAAGVPKIYSWRVKDPTTSTIPLNVTVSDFGGALVTNVRVSGPDAKHFDLYTQATVDGNDAVLFEANHNKMMAVSSAAWTSASGIAAHVLYVGDTAASLADVLLRVRDVAGSRFEVTPKGIHIAASTNYGGGTKDSSGSTSVADANEHSLISFAVAAETCCVIETTVVAAKSDGSENAAWKMIGMFRQHGAEDLIQVGETEYVFEGAGNPEQWDAWFYVDATAVTVDIFVQGEATTRFKHSTRIVTMTP